MMPLIVPGGRRQRRTWAWREGLAFDQWLDHEWSVPLNLHLSKLVKMGQLLVSQFAGVRYWVGFPERH